MAMVQIPTISLPLGLTKDRLSKTADFQKTKGYDQWD